MSKSKKTLLKTIEVLTGVITEKDRLIEIQDEENNDLREQLRWYIDRRPTQKLFTWQPESSKAKE